MKIEDDRLKTAVGDEVQALAAKAGGSAADRGVNLDGRAVAVAWEGGRGYDGRAQAIFHLLNIGGRCLES